MRALTEGLLAALLSALLAGPGIVSCAPSRADPRDASAAPDTGMDAPPGPLASAALSIAPAALSVPLSAPARFVVTLDLPAGGCAAERTPRLAAVPRSAPTILRV